MSNLPGSPSVSQAEAAAALLKRRQSRRDLLSFSQYTMPEYKPGRHHHILNGYINRMIHGDLRRLIVSMPPRHGKSELISRRLPGLLFGINPKETVIACSYSAELASRMNRDVQRIMCSPAYHNLFPEIGLEQW